MAPNSGKMSVRATGRTRKRGGDGVVNPNVLDGGGIKAPIFAGSAIKHVRYKGRHMCI